MTSKQKLYKTIFQGFLLLTLLVTYAQPVRAAEVGEYSGPEATVREFLCAPPEPDEAGKTILTGSVTSTEAAGAAAGDLRGCINKLFRFIMVAGAITAVSLLVIAGYMYMVDNGSETNVKTAKKLVNNTLIGMAILAFTFLILNFLNPSVLTFRDFRPDNLTNYDPSDNIFSGSIRTTGGDTYTNTASSTPGSFPYFKQVSGPWADKPYGNCGGATIRDTGCGPTSLASVIAYYQKQGKATGSPVDPWIIAQKAVQKGYRVCGSGSSPSMFAGIAPEYGLKARGIGWSEVEKQLKAGVPVIGRMGPGYFTSNGHYIIFYGIDSAGKVLVADSGPRNRTIAEASVVRSQAKDFYLITP
jgi:hypothetical protein